MSSAERGGARGAKDQRSKAIRIGRARWRPVLRMAWRNAMRAPGRTVLVAVLVGLPVLAAVSTDLFMRTSTPTREDRARWELGMADAQVIVSNRKRLLPEHINLRNDIQVMDKKGNPLPRQRDPLSVDPLKYLPAGTRLVPVRGTFTDGHVVFGDRSVQGNLRVLRGTDPMTSGAYLLRSGRYPKSGTEIAISSALAERLGLREPDARASLRVSKSATEVTVTGIVDNPGELGRPEIWASDNFTLPAAEQDPLDGTNATYLADLPDTSLASLKSLVVSGLENGIVVFPRDALLHFERWLPPELMPQDIQRGLEKYLDSSQLQTLALGALIISFGLLEIVLLAGAAFAVGIRRQTHELGLLSVVGGSGKDVRRAVLAQGLVLGLIGAVGGIVFGAAAPMLLHPWVERAIGHEVTTWNFAPSSYATFGIVGLLSGLAAAVIPAIGAGRMAPIAALNGRFRATAGFARAPKLGIVLLASGLVTGIAGSLFLLRQYEELRRVEETGQRGEDAPSIGGIGLGVLLGIVGLTLLAIGLVRMMPAIVSWLGALAGRLPLSLRLSFRDASRHRHRTAPAAAAIMIAVAGSIGVACMVASVDEQGRVNYVGNLPYGDAMLFPLEGPGKDLDAPAKVKDLLPNATAFHQMREAVLPKGRWPKGSDLWNNTLTAHGPAGSDSVAIVDPELLRSLPGKEIDNAVAALESGRAVVLSDYYVSSGGKVKLLPTSDPQPGPTTKPSWLPAFRLHVDGQWQCESLSCVMISGAAAKKLGYEVDGVNSIYIHPPQPMDQETRDKLPAAAEPDHHIRTENGYQVKAPLILIVVTAVSTLVTLVGVAVSVALSNAESRPDLATLAAVGAAPRKRRLLAASQAAFVGGLGCLTGLGLGVFLGFVGRGTMGTSTFAVPWNTLLVMVIAVPAFAALCAALLTRSQLPLVRRIE